MSKYALLSQLRAKAGSQEALATFLVGLRSSVVTGPGCLSWHCLRLSELDFAIFDEFTDDTARAVHLGNSIVQALRADADGLLAEAPRIDAVEVLASMPKG